MLHDNLQTLNWLYIELAQRQGRITTGPKALNILRFHYGAAYINVGAKNSPGTLAAIHGY